MLIFGVAAREDIDALLEKVNKMENNNTMANALAGASMAEDSVELILKAINDMQDKINAETDNKLKEYATASALADLEGENKSNARRIHYNEGILKEAQATAEANMEKIEANRKKIARMQTEIDHLRNR